MRECRFDGSAVIKSLHHKPQKITSNIQFSSLRVNDMRLSFTRVRAFDLIEGGLESCLCEHVQATIVQFDNPVTRTDDLNTLRTFQQTQHGPVPVWLLFGTTGRAKQLRDLTVTGTLNR